MKLPEIDTAPVGTPPDVSAPYRSFDRMAQTTAEGLKFFSQELIKSQTQKAALDLVKGLNDLETEIESQKTVSTRYVREKLGPDFEALAPEVRGQLTQQGLDINTGEPVELDREDIPTFLLADTLFDVQARRLLGQAARHIPAEGWASEFKDQAEMTVLARKARINERQMKAMQAYFIEEETSAAIEMANAGEFPLARETVAKSRVMDSAYKAKVLDEIDKSEQTRPVYEALRNDDYAAMAELLGQLNDPKKFGKLTQAERQTFSDRLKSEMRSFQTAVKQQDDRAKEAAAASGWRIIFDKKMKGEVPSYKDIPDPMTIKPEDQKQMLAYIDGMREGKDPKTDMVVYHRLSELARASPEKFAEYPIMRHANELSPADLKHFINLRGGGAFYDDFVSTKDAIKARLTERGVNLKDDDEEVRAGIANVESMIQHELTALGRKATLSERDEIIDRVMNEKVKISDPWWWKRSTTFVNPEIPARYETAIRKVYTFLARSNPQLEQRISPETLKATWKDFSTFESGIAEAWPFYARGKRLSPDESILVYGLLKSSIGEIDAVLNNAQQPITPASRSAIAVQMYFNRKQQGR